MAALQAALERHGVIFLAADGGEGLGVRLRSFGPPDEGLRPDQLTSDKAFAPMATQWRQCLSSCGLTRRCTVARRRATGWRAARTRLILPSGSGLSVTRSKGPQEL
jgi:hypothetical protein